MVLRILFAVCIIAEIIFTPLFLKAQWPGMCFKSLVYKMICSTGFVGVGVLSMFIADNTSTYAVMMVAGLVLGWIGDYFLHAKSTNTYFAIGFISFFLGHIMYIRCFIRTLPVIVPDYKMFDIPELAVTLAFVVVAVVSVFKFKIEFSTNFLKVAVGGYTLILITMFVKATALGIGYLLSGGEHGIWAVILLSLGAFGFMLSDASLGLILFGGQKGKKPLKVFNMVTYFAGQTMLASSILFIRG